MPQRQKCQQVCGRCWQPWLMNPLLTQNGNLNTFTFPLRFRYPGAELGQNKDAYDAGVSTLVPAVDDELSKMWLLQ